MVPLGERLAAEVTQLAICWRVVRTDGVALGFTTHDRPLLIAGLCYESAPGITPSAIVSSADLQVDTMEIAGALTDDAISAADLAAGRYDDAVVEIFMVDWRDPDSARQPLARGLIGSVEAGSNADSGFVASVRGPTAALAVTAVETYSPQCRAALGDRRCRVATSGRTRRVTVTIDAARGIALPADLAPAAYIEGRLRILDGPMAGLERHIIAADGDGLLLDNPPTLPAAIRIQLWEGCDKTFSTCRDRFANAVNFRGEPHVPGADLLMRFGAD